MQYFSRHLLQETNLSKFVQLAWLGSRMQHFQIERSRWNHSMEQKNSHLSKQTPFSNILKTYILTIRSPALSELSIAGCLSSNLKIRDPDTLALL